MSNRAWVTLATNDSYGLGALVLAHSLRRVGSAYPAVVLITPSVTEAMRDRLRAVFAEVVTVDVLDSRDAAHLALLQRPELGITFTKIHCWNLTQYDKCVFLDADTLVVQNSDELFDREELSAAPDVGWPDCFNSGVFVYTPSADTFSRLVQFAQERGSFDGGDQGLLNSFFSDWAHGDINKHLPFLYNVTSAAFYSYMPALKHYGQNLKIIHFIGAAKPWLQHFNWESRAVDAPEHLRQFLQLWWDLFVVDVHAQLDVSMVLNMISRMKSNPPLRGFIPSSTTNILWSNETILLGKSIYSHISLRSEHNNMFSKHSERISNVAEVEVEAPHHESTKEKPPVLPPQDVNEYFHYQPILDPESEFPWHRPDAHIEKDIPEQQIDMSDVFDPWDIFGGHIPPKPKDLTSPQAEEEAEEQTNLRKYVWEYYGQDRMINEPLEKNEQPVQKQQWDHIQFNSYQHNAEPVCIHVYNQTTYNQHPTQHEVQYEHHEHFHSYQEEMNNQTDNHNEKVPEQSHRNNTNFQEDYSHHQSANEYSVYNEHCDNLNHYSNNNYSNIQHINDQEHDKDFQNQSYTHVDNSHHVYFNHSQTQNIYSQQYEPNYNKAKETQKLTEYNPIVTEYQPNNYEPNTPVTYTQQIIDQHGCVEDAESCRNRKTENNTNVRMVKEKVNGDASNSEDELDDIIPRHPYDGFYLRHRVTIDSRGRKICTHEIPPIPSSSSSESSETQDYFSAEEAIMSDFVVQSGVAGNLARVTLGSSQREAIDELTRRQGWEAGNIDYMGVDSFDNIWAKISQTLSQGRPSPPKQSPPKEPTPPQTAPVEVEVITGEIAQEPVTDPIELAKEVVPTEETIPVQEPEVITSAVSSETAPLSNQQTAQIESLVQSETSALTDTSSVIETSLPIIEANVVPEVSAPASVVADQDVISAVQTQSVPEVPAESLPLTTAEPVVESVTATETPATSEEPILTEALKPAEKVTEPSPISEAPVVDETPVTVADTVIAEVVAQAPEIIAQSAVVDVPVSEIPVSGEANTFAKIPSTDITLDVEPVLAVSKEKTEVLITEGTTEGSVEDSVKVVSADTKPQTEIVPPEVEKKTEAQVTETTSVSIPVKDSSADIESQIAVLEAKEKTEATVITSAPVEPVAEPVKVPSTDSSTPVEPTLTEVKEKTDIPAPVQPTLTEVKEKTDIPAPVEPVVEAAKVAEPVQIVPTLPIASPVCPIESTPEKSVPSDSASDSPPLANTPSKEEIPDVSAAKSAERRKPAGKLQLSPPVAPDPLPTPDSELEDAASLAQSIIASELRTPTVTSPGSATSPSSPPAPLQHSRLSVDEPEVPTPPVGAVSLAQIGVKTKGKTSTAAQIESSVTEKPESATSTATEPAIQKTETAPAEVPKKKVVKKMVKKVSAASGDTPVPPPRKKEKKPKE